MIIDKDVDDMLDTISSYGIKVYLVGGYVRDTLAGFPSHDYDIVTGFSINDITRFLRDYGYNVIDTSKEFGTIAVMLNGRKIDIAEFRGDKYDMISRKPQVFPVKTIEEDLRRRDFTINSMAMEYPSGRIIDPFGGQIDLLTLKVLETVRQPAVIMLEDPLRMMRAARFAAKYNLKISPAVQQAIIANRAELTRISGERIHEELFKGFSLGRIGRYKYAMNLIDLHLLEIIFPEFKGAITIQHDHRGHHYGETLLQHMLDALYRYNGNNALIAMTIFLHDIGKMKSQTFEDGKIMFKGHDEMGARMLAYRLPLLKFTSQETSFMVRAIKNHLYFAQLKQASNPKKNLAKFFIEQHEDLQFLQQLITIAEADQEANYQMYFMFLQNYTNEHKILSGMDVIEFPPTVRARALNKARYYQLIGQGSTKEQLMHLIRTDFKEGNL